VRELIFSVLREHGLEPDPGGTDRDLASLPSAYEGGLFDVLCDGERIVGSVGLMLETPRTIRLPPGGSAIALAALRSAL